MRFLLHFLIYSCLVIGLFITFMYLMTVVDPGLLQFPEKANRMMRADSEELQEIQEVLPAEMYIDFTEPLNRSRNII